VNGGLARSEGRRVKLSAGASSETKSRVGLTGNKRERIGDLDPRWRETVIERFIHHQKWCVGRGTGVVMTTGSYEGYLSMEGIPDQHVVSSFTRRH